MNQTCKVCGEPAAGFHFGAFTCEGCKSFFGRSYNNISSINDCKNNNKCIINKKNRTSCKACRLKKCVMVGMSKSGSRYGRRSNWFKIHCLLQEQQQKMHVSGRDGPNGEEHQGGTPMPPMPNGHQNLGILGNNAYPNPLMNIPRTREELMLLGLEESFRHSASPSVSSPESHNSDSSVEIPDARRIPLLPVHPLFPPGLLAAPPGFLFPPGYHTFYSDLLQHSPPFNQQPVNHNNNNNISNNNISNNNISNHNNNNTNVRSLNRRSPVAETVVKREYLDAVLQRQRDDDGDDDDDEDEEVDVKTPVPTPSLSPMQEVPIDLSMKTLSERGSSPADSEASGSGMSVIMSERSHGSDREEESDCDSDNRVRLDRFALVKTTPLDLTRRV